MTIFAMGFIFIMVFTALVGIAAVVFLSMDAITSDSSTLTINTSTQNLYDIVRQINTNTIETVDESGSIQRWERSTEQ